MKFLNSFLFWTLTIAYYEVIFNVFSYDSLDIIKNSNIFLFSSLFSIIIISLLGLLNRNKIIRHVLLFILGLYFSLQFVFFEVFNSYFSFSILGLSDQLISFLDSVFNAIISNILIIILFFMPLILNIIFNKKIIFKRFSLYDYVYNFVGSIIIILSFINILYFEKDNSNSMYNLLFNTHENSLNIEKLGVLPSGLIDIKRTIFGFEEKIIYEEPVYVEPDIIEKVVEYNVLDLIFNDSSKEINLIHDYIKNSIGTNKNEYTGIFEDYNLIYINAESFSTVGVREDLTPTLYKLVNSGFVFNNFYTPNNLSTIGGEFQSLTGLFANNQALPTWRTGNNSFPFGLSTVFKAKGYNTYAYHNHAYNYQNRNKYLKSLGFDNYKGCYNGLEKEINCKLWPESDIELFSATMDEYVDNEPFLSYYMTVSGHLEYNFSGNAMAKKHKNEVKNLNYSTEAKAYLATQIELDQALELLINTLDKKGILEKTVIVLLADHYPYRLSLSDMNSLSSYERDGVVGVNHNSLIIWNPTIETTVIDKVCMSLDVIPTVYNLFGIKYDSRLFMGNDIFSDKEGLAILSNRSWVTDYGIYYANGSKFVSNGKEMPKDYIESINNTVKNRLNISKLIITTNYYQNISKKN